MNVQHETLARQRQTQPGLQGLCLNASANTAAVIDRRYNCRRSRAAFTMVELVIVMTIMVVVVSVAAPSLKGFLKGRNLENEAQRFLALTRMGQSRAVSEGTPVDMWMNTKQGRYGLAAVGGFTETRTNEWSYNMDENVQMAASQPRGVLTTSNFWTLPSGRGNGYTTIRFQPDGFIGENSPRNVKFRQAQGPEIWIVENANRQRYDIEFNHAPSRW
jgi:type II secretion system protein H